jgi:ribosomal protein L11 methyltransferase
MPWLQFSVTAPQTQAPLLELLFENLGALSVTLGDAADEPILEPDPGEQRLWSHTRVSALFDTERDADALDAALRQALPAEIAPSLSLERLGDRAWERAWMDGFHPMRFGDRLWVCPSGMQVDAANALVLDLDPGLAFGTGTHPTTALCLEWLDRHPPTRLEVLDYGCGSGVLALAALRLGAAAAVGVDHDPQALEASRENARRNGLAERLQVYLPGDEPQVPADLLLANILAAPLIDLAGELARRVRPGGAILLSGILQEQAEAVAAAYRPWFELAPPARRDEWVRIDGRRGPETGS